MAPPPSEPDRRISRIRLSSWWFTQSGIANLITTTILRISLHRHYVHRLDLDLVKRKRADEISLNDYINPVDSPSQLIVCSRHFGKFLFRVRLELG